MNKFVILIKKPARIVYRTLRKTLQFFSSGGRQAREDKKTIQALNRQSKLLKADSNKKIIRLKAQIDRLSQRVDDAKFIEGSALYRFLKMADSCIARAPDLEADVYCGHGVQALPAAFALKRTTGGKACCDVIETPSFRERSLMPNWSPHIIDVVDAVSHGFLREADILTTVSWTLSREMTQINNNISTLPNYKYKDDIKATDRLRKDCGVKPNEQLVLVLSTVTSALENVIEAVAKLGPSMHLVVVGSVLQAEYREKVEYLAETFGISERFKILPQVPYDELTGYANGADVGLIVRDPTIRNHRVSLPNRLFDYMASGLPVVTPYMPDISKILEEQDFGISIHSTTPEAWREAISAALENKEHFAKNAVFASQRLTWESLETSLPRIFGNPKTICFIGYNDLSKNNRTLRIAKSLVKQGVTVKIAGRSISHKTVKAVGAIPISLDF
ncbi:glycosyltransferase [Tateyamaria sp.]|nr:glycosyltransferase [Tateyamaria sp.]